MTTYYPGEFEIELEYQWATLTHKQRLNCTLDTIAPIGSEFADFTVFQKDATAIALDVALNYYVGLVEPLFENNTEFVGATLWRYAPNSFVRTYYATMELGTIGENAGGNLFASQFILTYRTALGNRMRVSYSECVNNGVSKTPQGSLAGATLALAQYFTSDDCIFHGRDGAYPAVGMNALSGQNEALFRKRYR